MRNLPSLGGLKAFESAARLGSFTAAASELAVTPGAISQQVKALEAQLGVRLFDRGPHSLALSAAGAQYLPAIRDAFDAIAMATAGLSAEPSQSVIDLTAPAIFAAGWLLPRLERFQAAHRDIELRLRNSNRLLTPGTDDVDAAIRHGRAGWGDLGCVYLFGDALVPVCSPEVAATLRGSIAAPGAVGAAVSGAVGSGTRTRARTDSGLRSDAGLRHAVLLETSDATTREPVSQQPVTPWAEWQAFAGVPGKPRQRLVLGDEGLTVQAALNGLGVALVDHHVVEGPLRQGRLVVPFEVQPWRRGTAWYLVYAQGRGRDGSFAALRTWLLSEVGGAR